jgi:hypothetical protein
MRLNQVALVAVATVFSLSPLGANAQSPKQLTAEDYARAEKFLGNNTIPLVTGLGFRPTWLDDGRFWYRTTVANGSAIMMVVPTKRSS